MCACTDGSFIRRWGQGKCGGRQHWRVLLQGIKVAISIVVICLVALCFFGVFCLIRRRRTAAYSNNQVLPGVLCVLLRGILLRAAPMIMVCCPTRSVQHIMGCDVLCAGAS